MDEGRGEVMGLPNNNDEEYRICDVCGKKMYDGYLIHDSEYYCTDKCLHVVYTAEEYKDLYEAGCGYWTHWY